MTRLILVLLLVSYPASALESYDLRGFPKWTRVVEQTRITPARHFSGNLKATLDALHARYRTIPYVEDQQNYGMIDYWATREELHARGSGDCEDFAIAEYFDLLDAGVPEWKLWVVIARIRSTGEIHAVLRAGDWILDRRSARVLSLAEAETFYAPLYRINRTGWAPLDIPELIASQKSAAE